MLQYYIGTIWVKLDLENRLFTSNVPDYNPQIFGSFFYLNV